MHSLWYWQYGPVSREDARPSRAVYLPLPWLRPALGSGWLPTAPRLIGFPVNTAFYAGLSFGLTHAYLAVRRRSRRRKGECIGCRYDLDGLPPDSPCPECGRPRGGTP
jgi:hypothetical protein